VEQKEWLVGPDGEKTVIQDFSVSRSTIKRTLHLSEKML